MVWRWRRRRRVDSQRAQLAADVRSLAGFADAVVEQARRLGADAPEGVAACTVVWHHWAWRLSEWASGGEPE